MFRWMNDLGLFGFHILLLVLFCCRQMRNTVLMQQRFDDPDYVRDIHASIVSGSYTAHPLALVTKQHALTAIFCRRKVNLSDRF